MNVEEVIKYCTKCISDERIKPSPSQQRIKTFEQVIDYIKKSSQPQPSEREDFKTIWQNHHKGWKKTLYVFSKNQDTEIDGIIMQIKEEVLTNQDSYKNISVAQFLDAILTNCDAFWKDNQFHTWSFNRHFRKILSPVLNRKKNTGAGNGGQKPSYNDVLSKDTYSFKEED